MVPRVIGNLLPQRALAVLQEDAFECTFLIPTRRDHLLSDGDPHAAEEWQWLDDQLFVLFNGRTVAPGLYEGFYRDPDTNDQVSDESRKYIVAVQSTRLGDLRALVAECCDRFQQKCIYLSVAGRVEFVEASDENTS